MKKYCYLRFLIVTLLVSLAAKAEDSVLPPVSKELIKKLEDWKANEKKALQQKIDEKNQQVANLLKKQLSEATKSGNLEGAIAIKKHIALLEPVKALEESAAKEHKNTSIPNLKGRDGFFLEKKWTTNDVSNWWRFDEGGTGEKFWEGNDLVLEITWKIDGNRITASPLASNREEFFEIDTRKKEVYLIKNGGRNTLREGD